MHSPPASPLRGGSLPPASPISPPKSWRRAGAVDARPGVVAASALSSRLVQACVRCLRGSGRVPGRSSAPTASHVLGQRLSGPCKPPGATRQHPEKLQPAQLAGCGAKPATTLHLGVSSRGLLSACTALFTRCRWLERGARPPIYWSGPHGELAWGRSVAQGLRGAQPHSHAHRRSMQHVTAVLQAAPTPWRNPASLTRPRHRAAIGQIHGSTHGPRVHRGAAG